MKSFIAILVCASFTLSALADPIRYRQRNRLARQELVDETTTTEIPTTTVISESESESETEQIVRSGPYPPSGWKPQGPLLVLPIDTGRGENVPLASSTPATINALDSNENVEVSSNLQNEEFSTESNDDNNVTTKNAKDAIPNSQIFKTDSYVQLRLQSSGQLKQSPSEQDEIAAAAKVDTTKSGITPEKSDDSEEVESNEPKTIKENGKLKVEDSEEKEDATTETTETIKNDSNNTKSTTDKPSANLETTSEPDAESVNVEQKSIPSRPQQPLPGASPVIVPASSPVIFLQLSDGTLQRMIYPFYPQSSQQLIQSPLPQPFAVPAASPRVVTYTSHYQSF